MEKKRIIFYFAVLLLGLTISFFVTNARFDIKTIAVLLFFLVFTPTIINPDIGLIIIIVSMLFSPEIIVGHTFRREISIRIEDIFLLVIIIAWVIRVSFTKDIAETFKTKLSAPFFLYIGACVLSSMLAAIFGYTYSIKHGFFSILKYLEYFLLFLMVRDSLRSLRQAKIFIIIFLLTALAVTLYSNVFIQAELKAGTEFFRTSPPVERGGGGEASTLGGYLVFMMAIASGLVLSARSMPVRIFLISTAILMFRPFLYSLSRGSYIAFIPMIAALAYFTRKGRLIFIGIIAAVSLVIGIFLPQMVKERIGSTLLIEENIEGAHMEWEASPQERLESWKLAITEKFPASPIFGHGVGKYFIDGQIFLTLANTGIIGLSLFLWVLFRFFRISRDVLNVDLVRQDMFSSGLTVGFLAGFIGLLFHAISTNTFIIIRIMEPFWFIGAIVLSLPKLLAQEKEAMDESK